MSLSEKALIYMILPRPLSDSFDCWNKIEQCCKHAFKGIELFLDIKVEAQSLDLGMSLHPQKKPLMS
jgi:hypothetical protein